MLQWYPEEDKTLVSHCRRRHEEEAALENNWVSHKSVFAPFDSVTNAPKVVHPPEILLSWEEVSEFSLTHSTWQRSFLSGSVITPHTSTHVRIQFTIWIYNREQSRRHRKCEGKKLSVAPHVLRRGLGREICVNKECVSRFPVFCTMKCPSCASLQDLCYSVTMHNLFVARKSALSHKQQSLSSPNRRKKRWRQETTVGISLPWKEKELEESKKKEHSFELPKMHPRKFSNEQR